MAELDLDAIRTRQAARRWVLTLGPDGNMTRAVGDITALLALVRRLQQENEELRAERDLWRVSTRNAGRLLARVDPE